MKEIKEEKKSTRCTVELAYISTRTTTEYVSCVYIPYIGVLLE